MKVDVLFVILGIAFVALKIAKIISWSWWIVVSPFGVAILLDIIGLLLAMAIVSKTNDAMRRR